MSIGTSAHVVDAADRVVEGRPTQLVHPLEPTLWRHHLGLEADEHLESSRELSLQGSGALDICGEDPRQIRRSQVLLVRIEIFTAQTRRVLGHSVDAEASVAGALEYLGQRAIRVSAELTAVPAVKAEPGHVRDDTLAAMEELWDRILRASKLEPDVYEEVEADQSATRQAALVVVLSALAAGIGHVGTGGVFGLIVYSIAGLIAWYVWAYLTYFIGTPPAPRGADRGRLRSTPAHARLCERSWDDPCLRDHPRDRRALLSACRDLDADRNSDRGATGTRLHQHPSRRRVVAIGWIAYAVILVHTRPHLLHVGHLVAGRSSLSRATRLLAVR